MTNTLYIHEIHHLHSEWNSVMDLTRDEILSFENRLQEIAKANTRKDILLQVEHFQNPFIRQKEILDALRNDIHEDELRIAENVKEDSVAVEHIKLEENFRLKDGIQTFQKIFNKLRSEYMLFMANIL